MDYQTARLVSGFVVIAGENGRVRLSAGGCL